MGKTNIKPKFLQESEVYYGYFRNALNQYLNDGHDRKVLASDVGISEASICGYVHEDPKKRKKPGFQTQVAIASYIGFGYIDFLLMGAKDEPLKQRKEVSEMDEWKSKYEKAEEERLRLLKTILDTMGNSALQIPDFENGTSRTQENV